MFINVTQLTDPLPLIVLFFQLNYCHKHTPQDYESGIPLEYLKGLDASYKKFLEEMRLDKTFQMKFVLFFFLGSLRYINKQSCW